MKHGEQRGTRCTRGARSCRGADLSSGADGGNLHRAETCAESREKISFEGFRGEELGANTDKGSRVRRWAGRGFGRELVGVLVAGRHGPSPLHPPDREGVAQSFVGQVVAAGQFGIHLIALQHLIEEVDVARRQLQDLDLAQLV